MRDLNRKVEKFIKAKEIGSASTKASRDSALTPHVIYGVSSSPKTFAKINNNLSTRGFSMTVSFFNPRFEKNPVHKEIAIRHEDRQTALNATSDKNNSPVKRDPIVQDNGEHAPEARSCIKFTPHSHKSVMFTEEQVFSKKIQGEYNHVYNARSQSPKIESVRTNIPKRWESPDEPRRQLKFVNTPHLIKPNPITEGDVNSIVVVKRERNAPEISEETKKINDRKTVLFADRGSSTKGKVFRDSNISFDDVRAQSARVDTRADRSFLGARLGSPTKKPEDSISGLMEYKHALTYRDQGVSDKCNNVPMSRLMTVNTEN